MKEWEACKQTLASELNVEKDQSLDLTQKAPPTPESRRAQAEADTGM